MRFLYSFNYSTANWRSQGLSCKSILLNFNEVGLKGPEQRMKWLCRAGAMKDVKRQRVHFWMCPFHLLMERRRRYWYWIRHHFTSNSSSATWNDSGKYYYFVALLFSSQIANPFWLMGAIDFLFSFQFFLSLVFFFFLFFPFFPLWIFFFLFCIRWIHHHYGLLNNTDSIFIRI